MLNGCRFCEGNFVTEMETTIGVDFYLSEIDVNGKKIKVHSSHCFRCVDAHVVCVCV